MALTEKVALVLGGTGGLGSTLVRRFVAEGSRVFATYHSGKTPSAATPRSSVTMVRTNATDEHDVIRLFDQVLTEAERVDIVVNTIGGYLPPKPLTQVSLEEWERMMDINLLSAFLSTREALRRMAGKPFGRVINISAMIGLRPLPERIPYAISKASVSLLTELAALEVRGTGITVNAIAPGMIATEANLASLSGSDIPPWITPDQIGDIIVSLCSPSSSAVNGTTVRAFGGL
jgi:NAD(P)-dependent dehydrogenase (short-subunit alcohol dehydrogenase family)